MLKNLGKFALILASFALFSCGGGSGTINGQPGGGGDTGAATVQVLSSSPQLNSDRTGLTTVDITAVVKDSNNVLLADAPVTFSANQGGVISVTTTTTDGNGVINAKLSNGPGNVTNRTITVTATSGSAQGSVDVAVSGTTLTISGPTALPLGTTGTYSIKLKDSAAVGINGAAVTVASALGNTLSSASLTTGAAGDAQFTLTATQSGNDTVTVSALGLNATAAVAVSGDSFAVTAPAAGTEIPLSTPTVVTATWTINGVPQANKLIQFASTRGTITGGDTTATTDLTDANGVATVSIQATGAGTAVITATTPGPSSTQATQSVEFVAVTAATIDLQAEPFTVRVNQQTDLTAVVRDGSNNPVKNKVVAFQIITDPTSGTLSVAQATTDSQGKASSIYTAGSVASPVGGVQIQASVIDNPPVNVTDTVDLTVSGQALAISLGTGNELFEVGTATFAKEWVVFVTDADGNPVANKPVQVSIRSVNYLKGYLDIITPPSGSDYWGKPAGTGATCPDEDVNLNGILDGVGTPQTEDLNGSGLIEAGNIALVAAVPESAPADDPCSTAGSQGTAANVVTNSQGRARVCVFYPQSYNLWVDVRIAAKASVQGTEFSKSQTFTLEALAADIHNVQASPPGATSPFGPENDCSIPPPP